MKEILIPKQTLWDDKNERFIEVSEQTLVLEHSLKAIRLWESKYKKPYMSKEQKTAEEVLDHLKYMTVNKVDPIVYSCLTEKDLIAIKNYMDDPMTATTISTFNQGKKKSEIITAELIYYWMVAQNIPWQFENWHINQLITLIQVCSIKSDPNPKKVGKKELAERNRMLNAQRRAKYKSKG